jgi:hypothetical protein
VALGRIRKWQSAEPKVAISRNQRWQSAESNGGNQPNQNYDENSIVAVTPGNEYEFLATLAVNKTASGESRRKKTKKAVTPSIKFKLWQLCRTHPE